MNPTTIDYSNSDAYVFVRNYVMSNLPRQDGKTDNFIMTLDEKFLDFEIMKTDITRLQYVFNYCMSMYIELYNEDYEDEYDDNINFLIADAYFDEETGDSFQHYEGPDKKELFMSIMSDTLHFRSNDALRYHNLLLGASCHIDTNSDDSDDSDIDPVV